MVWSTPLQGLDPRKMAMLSALLSSLADRDLASIAPGLQAMVGAGAAGDAMKRVLEAEFADRRMRDRVFAPLLPLLRRPSPSALELPPSAVAQLWRRLKRRDPEAFDAAAPELSDAADPQIARNAADRLALSAAACLEDDDPETELLRGLLAVCPLARATLPRLRGFLRTGSEEHAAALRLAYRDAAAIDDDAPPRLMDVLAGHLEQPWQALRLVCAVMDRPSDQYLAVSELGRFGEDVLDDVDGRIHDVRSFSGDAGVQAAAAAAEAACGAVQALGEFDRSLDLGASGVWAKRIAAQRRNLARAVEMRLRQADPAMARALPECGGRRRGVPNLDLPVEDRTREHAEALLGFTVAVRTAAHAGGFAVARAKAAEALDLRLSSQADDLLQIARDYPGPTADAARDRLAVIATFMERLRDNKAADIVRRRAAAA